MVSCSAVGSLRFDNVAVLPCLVHIKGYWKCPTYGLGTWGGLRELATCNLCGVAGVGLWHIRVESRELLVHRAELPFGVLACLPAWALESCGSVPELELKVRYTGLCLRAVICGYKRVCSRQRAGDVTN